MDIACFPAAIYFARKHTIYLKVRSLTRFVLLASGVSGSFGVRSSLFHLMFLRIDSHLHFLKGELCNTERDRFMVSKPAGSSRRAHIRNVKCVFFSFFASKREEKRP